MVGLFCILISQLTRLASTWIGKYVKAIHMRPGSDMIPIFLKTSPLTALTLQTSKTNRAPEVALLLDLGSWSPRPNQLAWPWEHHDSIWFRKNNTNPALLFLQENLAISFRPPKGPIFMKIGWLYFCWVRLVGLFVANRSTGIQSGMTPAKAMLNFDCNCCIAAEGGKYDASLCPIGLASHRSTCDGKTKIPNTAHKPFCCKCKEL